MSHISEDVLELYALSRVPKGSELGRIEKHLFMCEICADSLEPKASFRENDAGSAPRAGSRAAAERAKHGLGSVLSALTPIKP